mgnify:CR=1 FL=1
MKPLCVKRRYLHIIPSFFYFKLNNPLLFQEKEVWSELTSHLPRNCTLDALEAIFSNKLLTAAPIVLPEQVRCILLIIGLFYLSVLLLN